MTVGRAVWPELLKPEEAAWLRPSPNLGDLDRAPNVLVVGGGIIGCATAAACVRAGLGSVVVLERESALGAGASGGAAGLLVPESHVDTDPPPFVELMRRSLTAWRDLEATWPGGVGLQSHTWRGHTQARANPLRALARLAASLPAVATSVKVTGVECRDGAVASVHTSLGAFRPRHLVLATGLPPFLEGLPANHIPAGEVKGHMLCTVPTHLEPPTSVRDADLARAIDGGRLLVGGTLDVGDAQRSVRPEVVARMWGELLEQWPEASAAAVEYTWACFRPAHPDHLPVIDRVPGIRNAWLTSGHYKTGILLAAATGQILAEWLASGDPGWDVAPYSVTRASLSG